MKTGILLINLGTPEAATVPAVRRYLAEFLMDKYVVDIPAPLRWLLVHGIILRTRPKSSAEAYQQVWTDAGSPLLVHGIALRDKVAKALGDDYQVELGMRYASPSIASAVKALCDGGYDDVIALPLFPQYSTAATESALVSMKAAFNKQSHKPNVRIQRDFYNHPAFIDAYASIIRQYWNPDAFDHLLMSYHGLPVKHLTKVGCERAVHCAKGDSCPIQQPFHPDCYRAQSYATSHLIASALQLNPTQYSVSFQSRLGKTPWIKPYTDEHLAELIKRGVKNLAVVCPSFVADCLETLEEIGIRAKEQWESLGGETLTMIPCLNEDPEWIKAVIQLLKLTPKPHLAKNI